MIEDRYHAEYAEPEPLMSRGQSIAVLLMAPWIFLWATDYYGLDLLGWLLRAMGVAP